MPSYDYLCGPCNTIFERVSLMSEMKRWIKCPMCSKRATRYIGDQRLNFDLKGPGWTPNFDNVNASRQSYADGWYKDEIKNTQDVLKYNKGTSPYSRMSLSEEGSKQAGGKRLSESEKKEANEQRAKVVRESAKNMDKGDAEYAKSEHRRFSK